MQNNCLSLREYERIAVRYLSKNLPSGRKNPDYINDIIYYMLRSDITYKPNIGTMEGRRMTYAKFAVQHIRDAMRRNKGKQTYSLDKAMIDGKSSGSQLAHNDLSPLDQVEFNELLEHIDSETLTGLESCAIREYYLERIPILDIANKYEVTRQSIYLAIARGLEKVRKMYGEENSN